MLDVLIPKDVDLMFDFVVNLLENEQVLQEDVDAANIGDEQSGNHESSVAVDDQNPSCVLYFKMCVEASADTMLCYCGMVLSEWVPQRYGFFK